MQEGARIESTNANYVVRPLTKVFWQLSFLSSLIICICLFEKVSSTPIRKKIRIASFRIQITFFFAVDRTISANMSCKGKNLQFLLKHRP